MLSRLSALSCNQSRSHDRLGASPKCGVINFFTASGTDNLFQQAYRQQRYRGAGISGRGCGPCRDGALHNGRRLGAAARLAKINTEEQQGLAARHIRSIQCHIIQGTGKLPGNRAP